VISSGIGGVPGVARRRTHLWDNGVRIVSMTITLMFVASPFLGARAAG
jgi:hypothetical protein